MDKPKVIDLFAKKAEKAAEESPPPIEKESDYDFAADMERNRILKERKEKERLNANKSVLRSYRIKH